MSLDQLRERNAGGKFDKFIKASEKTSSQGKKNFNDPDLFYPQLDKAGNGLAVIRFLPGLVSEDEPIYVEEITHGFKGINGKFFKEYCPTKYEKDCPVCASNKKIVDLHGGEFDVIPESAKKIVRSRSRKIQFYANILIIENPSDPELAGKVMKFRFGKKIYEKILAKVNPKFETETPIPIWDFEEGANFKLIIKKKDGFTNYDDCYFDVPSIVDADTTKRCLEEQFPINGYLDPKLYKDYNVIRNRLGAFIGHDNLADLPDGGAGGTFDPQPQAQAQTSQPDSQPKVNPLTDNTAKNAPGENPMTGENVGVAGDDTNPTETDISSGAPSGDDMDYFMDLAGGEEK